MPSLIDVASACATLLEIPPGPTVADYVGRVHNHLGRLVGSADGYVVLSVRSAPPARDPLRGFRPLHAFTVGARETRELSLTPELMRDDRRVLDDPAIRRVMEGLGAHRVLHDPDPRTVPQMRGSMDERFWNDRNIRDRLKAVHALDAGFELHFSFDRFAGERRFTAAERRTVERMVPALGPWARRLAFLHGHGAGLTPLSARERDALCFLLSAEPQKLLGARLEVSAARARELVRSLYQKLGVDGRIELMSRWMSAGTRAPSPPVVSTVRKRRGK